MLHEMEWTCDENRIESEDVGRRSPEKRISSVDEDWKEKVGRQGMDCARCV